MEIFARRPPEPVRLPVPDLRRLRRPASGVNRWAHDVRAYTAQAMDHAETRGGDVLPLACEALVAYFDVGDNDDAQMQTLRDMVGSGVRLGAALAAVERLAGVEGSSTDPRAREAMATATTPNATGMGWTRRRCCPWRWTSGTSP